MSIALLALAFILVGALLMMLSGYVRPMVAPVLYWFGVVLLAVGAVLLLAPVINWLYQRLREAYS